MKGTRTLTAGLLMLAAFVLLAGCTLTGGSATPATGELKDGQVEWAFTQADQHPEQRLTAIIDGANETLDIAVYSLTYPDIVQAIKNAAQRGVKVRLITDRIQASGKSQKEALKLLGSAGIPLKINTHSGLMHLKMTVADGQVATTGSFNYSKAASTANDEVFVVFHDEGIARSFEEQFEAMWNDDSRFETLQASIAMPEASDSEKSGAEDAKEQQEQGEEAAALASCPNPQIKGNINAKGDKIYHVPGGAQYEATKPEAMFCTEDEAVSAGYRKAGS
ncbi:phospholipase D-like domain-containing protein [Cohnella lubricantis]|nr:phospholipase D-like domain-containing protein [Cohnella lubricantis]MBP2120391.1 HKD family nuclease [Cohnella lubricantis]